MKIIISFEAENDSFCEDFDGEIRNIMQQATDYLVDRRNSDILKDVNGNKVGTVFRSTIRKPKRRNPC